jgi:hypothetical protein
VDPHGASVCYDPNYMARSKLAVAVYHGIAAVSLLFVSTLFLRSSASSGSASDHGNVTPVKQSEVIAKSAIDSETGKTVSPKQREVIAEQFVKEKLQIWQQRLNLADWNIRANLVRTSQLQPNTLGNVHWDLDTKEATIGVLSTYDYKLPFQAMLDDMEVTVVHELVHIQLASLPRSEASRGQEEHAVTELTDALLKLAKK